MVNYSNGKVYKIECPTGDGEVYVGSTTKMYLSQRMDEHRRDFKGWKDGKRACSSSSSIFDKYGIDNCQIVLIESVNALSKDELHACEAHWIKQLQCVNKHIPGRSSQEYNKEYCEKNKEAIAKSRKEYYEKNKEVIVQSSKEYCEKNKEALAQRRKEYNENNKESVAQRRKEYRGKNKETIVQYSKEYSEKNKEVLAQRSKEYYEKNKEAIAQRSKKKRVAAAAARATAGSV